MMYTAEFTRIIGTEQRTIELPCRNIDQFSKTSDLFNQAAELLGAKPFSIVISLCPYGYITTAQRKGEYVFGTLHKN